TMPFDYTEAASALVEIARRLELAERSALLTEALAVGQTVVDPREQVETLAALASLYAETGDLSQAIATVNLIKDSGDHTWALARLATYLPEAMVRDALDLA